MRSGRSPPIARTREALRDELDSLRSRADTVALVPTMGAFHEGHLSLIERAGELGDAVVVSIFVNPLQFAPSEDFDAYPRDLERDVDRGADRGAHLVFAPDDGVMYPSDRPRVQVDPGELGERLCGAFRPGHFRGVLTVVAKLFGLVRPDWAVFGRKDFQQAVLIRRMVDDLDLGVAVDVAPLVREADGLALSSRNLYLSEAERRDALGLWRALSAADELFRSGETAPGPLLEEVRAVVSEHPRLDLQYAEIVDPDNLDRAPVVREGFVAAVAAFCGSTRLIDNVVLGQPWRDVRVPAGADADRNRGESGG